MEFDETRQEILKLPESKRLKMAHNMHSQFPDLTIKEIEDYFKISLKGSV